MKHSTIPLKSLKFQCVYQYDFDIVQKILIVIAFVIGVDFVNVLDKLLGFSADVIQNLAFLEIVHLLQGGGGHMMRHCGHDIGICV